MYFLSGELERGAQFARVVYKLRLRLLYAIINARHITRTEPRAQKQTFKSPLVAEQGGKSRNKPDKFLQNLTAFLINYAN